MFEIIPSPGTEDKEWSAIEKKIELVKPLAKTLHIDVVDGKFTDNTTFLDPAPYKKYEDTFLLEVHFMVEEPINYLKSWSEAGFRRFIGQIEKMSDQALFIAEGQKYGEVGLAIDTPSFADQLQVSMVDLDALLIMAVKAGHSGQQFDESQLEKIKSLSDKPLVTIAVDGGINTETIKKVFDAGARRFTVTSALFNSPNPGEEYKKLHDICNSLLG